MIADDQNVWSDTMKAISSRRTFDSLGIAKARINACKHASHSVDPTPCRAAVNRVAGRNREGLFRGFIRLAGFPMQTKDILLDRVVARTVAGLCIVRKGKPF